MKKNNKIKNLNIDWDSFRSLAYSGTLTLVSIGLMPIVADIGFVNGSKYPDYVIVQDPWENQSKDEDSYYYVRNSRYYDLDESSYIIFDSLKGDIDKLEVEIKNPDDFTTEVYCAELSDSEKSEEKRLIYPDEYSKKVKLNKNLSTLFFIGLLGSACTGAKVFLEEKRKILNKI